MIIVEYYHKAGHSMENNPMGINPNPFDKLLDQIAQMLQFAYDNADKPIPAQKSGEIEAKIASLEKQMEELKKLNQKFLEGSGVNDYVFQTMLSDKKAETISGEHRDILQRAQDLKAEAQAASKDLLKASIEAKAEGKDLKKKEKDDKKPKLRKGKFRSMGGTKNWKPL